MEIDNNQQDELDLQLNKPSPTTRMIRIVRLGDKHVRGSALSRRTKQFHFETLM